MTHEELPSYNQAPAGSIRFNTDSKKLEVYILGPVGVGTLPNGIWMEVDSWSPDLMTGGTRGLIAGGYTGSSQSDVIDYINVNTTGNAIDFGDMITAGQNIGGGSASRTRGIAGGMSAPNIINTIEFVTIASTGASINFGDLSLARTQLSNFSNSTRSIFAGGSVPGANVTIDYITIASTGNAADFGDMAVAVSGRSGSSDSHGGL